MYFVSHTKIASKRTNGGFTVVELMVTLAIVILVTGVVMLQYSSFNSSVLLTSQAYLTAFDLREAQSLAISVRGQRSQFREEYGLYFDMNASDPAQYLLFQDDNSNGDNDPVQYNEGEEIGTPYKLDSRFVFKDLCVTTAGGSETCYSEDATMSSIAITFKRPDFDASFKGAGVGGNIQSARITIGTENGELTKSIVIYGTGQIGIE